jgi:hypothetical protein
MRDSATAVPSSRRWYWYDIAQARAFQTDGKVVVAG